MDRGNLGFAAAAAGSVEGRRGGRKGRGPELLEGDRLENTPKMVFLTYFSLGLNVLYLLQVGIRGRPGVSVQRRATSGVVFRGVGGPGVEGEEFPCSRCSFFFFICFK